MGRKQVITVAAAIIAVLALYFGFDTIPSDMRKKDNLRQQNLSAIDVRNLLLNAEKEVSPDMLEEIKLLQHEARSADSDSVKIERWKALSSRWYQLGYPGIAGHYAAEIAEVTRTATAWSIAGTTYTMGLLDKKQEEQQQLFCAEQAESAFQNAISLEPENLDHKLNLATSYAEYPPQEEPMKGIMMLLDLSRSHPEYAPGFMALARFGIKTGQYDKARQRLETVLNLEPDNVRAHCMMGEVYTALKDMQNAAVYNEKCAALRQ